MSEQVPSNYDLWTVNSTLTCRLYSWEQSRLKTFKRKRTN